MCWRGMRFGISARCCGLIRTHHRELSIRIGWCGVGLQPLGLRSLKRSKLIERLIGATADRI